MPHLGRSTAALLAVIGHVYAGGNYRADYLNDSHTPVGEPIQSCVSALNPNITIYEGCRPVVGNNSITVQANLTEFATYVGKTFRSLIYVQSSGCRMGIVNFACGIFYPKCDRDFGTICPCEEEVGALHGSCEGDSYGRFLANFSVSLLQNLTRDHRNCGTLLPVHNHYDMPCYHPQGATGQMQCPPGTVQPDQHGARVVTVDRENGPNWPLVPRGVWGGGEIEACKLPCSSNLFEDGEARASVTLVTTLAWISACACVLLFVLFHVGGKKELSTWPARLQVYFTGCAFFLSLALTMGSWIEYSDSMWCENASLCTIQALMLEYFGFALGMWWLVICFNLFLTVKALHDRAVSPQDPWDGGDSTEWYERFYHLFAWGVPGVFTLILSSKDKLGYPVYGNPSYCWIADEDSSEWSWFFFHAEILAMVFIGMIFFVVSVFWLRSLTKESIPTWRGLLTSIWGVVIHVVTFAVTFAFMGIYQVTLTTQQDIIRQAYEEYIGCVIKRWWMTAFPGEEPEPCVIASHPNLVLMDIQSALFASLGLVTFAVFGTPHLLTLVKLVRRRYWQRTRQNSRHAQVHSSSTVKDSNDADASLLRSDMGEMGSLGRESGRESGFARGLGAPMESQDSLDQGQGYSSPSAGSHGGNYSSPMTHPPIETNSEV